MLDIRDIFADFQLYGHKITKCCFNYPDLEEGSELTVDYKVDFEIQHAVENIDNGNYFGVLNFTVFVLSDDDVFIELIVEGAFMGNEKAYDFDSFKKLLKINGTATLSQIARLHLMKITTDVGIGQSLVMPMINVYDLIEQKEGQEE